MKLLRNGIIFLLGLGAGAAIGVLFRPAKDPERENHLYLRESLIRSDRLFSGRDFFRADERASSFLPGDDPTED